MRHLLLAAAALCSVVMLPAIAEAASGFSTANVNMRSGPSTAYPAVTLIPVGAPLRINGCLADTPWCDVSFAGGRGWVAGRYVQALYQQRRVYVGPQYYRPLGIPTITFDLDNYWDRNYRGRDFYRDRDRWSRGPDWDRNGGGPVYRRPPPPVYDPQQDDDQGNWRRSPDYYPDDDQGDNNPPRYRPRYNGDDGQPRYGSDQGNFDGDNNPPPRRRQQPDQAQQPQQQRPQPQGQPPQGQPQRPPRQQPPQPQQVAPAQPQAQRPPTQPQQPPPAQPQAQKPPAPSQPQAQRPAGNGRPPNRRDDGQFQCPDGTSSCMPHSSHN